jgi:hypothetical protein
LPKLDPDLNRKLLARVVAGKRTTAALFLLLLAQKERLEALPEDAICIQICFLPRIVLVFRVKVRRVFKCKNVAENRWEF